MLEIDLVLTIMFALNFREGGFRLKISSDRWIEYARTAFLVDPRIALSLVSRFRTNPHLRAEVTQLIQVCEVYLTVNRL